MIIEDTIFLKDHDKIDCVNAVKEYIKCYLYDDSQHVFAKVQSQHEYAANCASDYYIKLKIIWIKCDQVICYIDCSICLTDIKQWI